MKARSAGLSSGKSLRLGRRGAEEGDRRKSGVDSPPHSPSMKARVDKTAVAAVATGASLVDGLALRE